MQTNKHIRKHFEAAWEALEGFCECAQDPKAKFPFSFEALHTVASLGLLGLG